MSFFANSKVMRSLRVPLTSRMLFDVLSRLVETATELGEDMQVILYPYSSIILKYFFEPPLA